MICYDDCHYFYYHSYFCHYHNDDVSLPQNLGFFGSSWDWQSIFAAKRLSKRWLPSNLQALCVFLCFSVKPLVKRRHFKAAARLLLVAVPQPFWRFPSPKNSASLVAMAMEAEWKTLIPAYLLKDRLWPILLMPAGDLAPPKRMLVKRVLNGDMRT